MTSISLLIVYSPTIHRFGGRVSRGVPLRIGSGKDLTKGNDLVLIGCDPKPHHKDIVVQLPGINIFYVIAIADITPVVPFRGFTEKLS